MNKLLLACLAIPIVLLIAVYGFGVQNPIIYWIAFLMCPLIHLVMMRSGKKCH